MLIINTGDKNTIAIQISMIIINIGLKAHKWIVAIEPSTIPRLDDTYATTTPLTRLLQLALAIAIAGHTRAKEDITPLLPSSPYTPKRNKYAHTWRSSSSILKQDVK